MLATFPVVQVHIEVRKRTHRPKWIRDTESNCAYVHCKVVLSAILKGIIIIIIIETCFNYN